MNNEITLTVEGWVARPPQRHGHDDSTWVTFRVGSTAWWWDAQGERRDAPTTWFDVKVSQKDLAENVLLSLKNGDAVIVTGRLSQHYWTDRDGKERTSMQIAARSVGPNLRWGQARWCRRSAVPMALDPDAAANGVGDSPAAGGDLVPGPAPAGGPTGGETQAVAQTGEAVGEAQDDYGRQAFDLADAAMAGGADCDPELIGASAAG